MNGLKCCFVDVETTGLDPSRHGIHEVAAIFDVEGVTVDRCLVNVAPFPSDQLDEVALKVSGRSAAEIYRYGTPQDAHQQLITRLSKYVDRYDPADKFYFIAYNSPFDSAFLRRWFEKNGDNYFGSYFFFPDICVMRIVALSAMDEGFRLPNFKLPTVADHFGIADISDDKWHEALFDIEVTRKIFYKLFDHEA